jgi:succinate-semialdehyde dehydrogenase/glutarate-semialdehyde dehydrogenase
MITMINPANGKKIKEYAVMKKKEVSGIIADVSKAQKGWSEQPMKERARILNRVADLLEKDKNKLAQLIAEEMGKPLKQGVGEAGKCAWVCRYYAEQAENFLKDEPVDTDASKSYVSFQPLGTVLAIMPWNYPLWQVFRFAAPALMAGNAVLLKHSQNSTGCSLAIEKLFAEAGLPDHVFRSLIIEREQTEDVIAHKQVHAVTLTGSTAAGKAVATAAGKHLKKCVLELGGSDPYLVLDDADIDLAAKKCVEGRLLNSGQSCIAAKRWIVTEKVHDRFLEKTEALLRQKKVGDPFDESTDVGPMARGDLRDELHQQVLESLKAGAQLHMGGEIPDRDGFYYPVTLLSNVQPGSPAYDDELFGPVASVIKAKDEEDAIRIANDSVFGLGAAVFSRDTARAENIAKNRLHAGCCFVNDFVKSDPRLPFGGVGESGYGRELSRYGILEFVNVKTVWVG